MGGMPSARGLEWKSREMKESTRKFKENIERIFPDKKPWYERDDNGSNKRDEAKES